MRRMARFGAGLGAIFPVVALAACGAEPAQSTAGGAPVSEAATPGPAPRACDLVDLAAATRVIGAGTEQPGGDTEELTCLYSNAGVAMLTIQLAGPELYDQITIMPPHEPVDIGSRGRYSVQENGATAVQFATDAHSVTMSVQPLGTNRVEYLEPLLTAARDAAGRLR